MSGPELQDRRGQGRGPQRFTLKPPIPGAPHPPLTPRGEAQSEASPSGQGDGCWRERGGGVRVWGSLPGAGSGPRPEDPRVTLRCLLWIPRLRPSLDRADQSHLGG